MYEKPRVSHLFILKYLMHMMCVPNSLGSWQLLRICSSNFTRPHLHIQPTWLHVIITHLSRCIAHHCLRGPPAQPIKCVGPLANALGVSRKARGVGGSQAVEDGVRGTG